MELPVSIFYIFNMSNFPLLRCKLDSAASETRSGLIRHRSRPHLCPTLLPWANQWEMVREVLIIWYSTTWLIPIFEHVIPIFHIPKFLVIWQGKNRSKIIKEFIWFLEKELRYDLTLIVFVRIGLRFKIGVFNFVHSLFSTHFVESEKCMNNQGLIFQSNKIGYPVAAIATRREIADKHCGHAEYFNTVFKF